MLKFTHTTILVFIFSIQIFYAQTKQDNIVNEAIALRGLGKYEEAMKTLDDCLVKYPNFEQALFIRANWTVIEKKYAEALPFLEKLESINPNFNPLQKRMIAECYFNQKDFLKAEYHIKDFLKNERLSPQNKQFGNKLLANIEFVKTQPNELFTIQYEPLNIEVNSTFSEYFPSTNADESALYFTRKNREGEDIWVAYRSGGKWSFVDKIDEPELEDQRIYTSINTFDNDGAHTISADGRHLFFTSCQRPGGLGSCDLYFASKKGNQWGKPKILPTVNTKHWESQPCISADGKTLFFVSSRPGGQGGSDIYVSYLSSSGFSEPQNLGDKINTEADEDRPFIHPDGKTLYFSSDGHPGFGGKDLYMSRLINGEWQTPINLGSQINSTSDEVSIFINALGTKAYIAKQTEATNRKDFDLFTFDLPEKYRPLLSTYIKGIVLNAKTNQPLKAAVKLTDIEESKQITSITSDEQNGDFLLTLTADKIYGFNVIKEGFAVYSENYTFEGGGTNANPKVLEIKLLPLESGTSFELRNVFFETGKYDLKPISSNELNFVIDILKQNPNIKILIAGHTDNIGSESSNKTLSENRAQSVMNYLIDKGIDKGRLSSKGYGSSKPISDNNSEEGRAKNRRTEIEIL